MAKPNHLFRRGRLVCAGLAIAVAAAMLSGGGAAAEAVGAPARAPSLLSVRLNLGTGSGPAAVAILSVPTTGLNTLQASLNGHPVAVPPVTGSGGQRVLNLAELGRLRFGTNRLRVRLVMLDGAVKEFSRTFTVSRHRDIVVARALAPATVGHPVILDASRSLLVPGAGGLATARWRLVRRPAGSHARLGSATGAQVTMRPDVPGHYLIALRVGAGRATGVDLLNAAVIYPEPLVPFNTIAQDHSPVPNPGVQIGNSFYASPGRAIQMLVLYRSTLALAANLGFNGDANGISQAAYSLETYYDNPKYLVVLTHPGPQYHTPPIANDSHDALEALLGLIGGTVPAQWQFGRSDCWSGGTENCYGDSAKWERNTWDSGSFSFIGVPTPGGQAWRETAAQLGRPDGNGPITGYFTRGSLADGTNNYTVVVGPDPYVPVQTCTANGCGVQVGDHTYPRDAQVSNGMHVVVLDRTTLNLITNTTVTTAGQLDGALQAGTPPVVGHYTAPAGVNDQRVVIMQSIGTGNLSGTVPPQLFAHVNQFGGTPEYLWNAISSGSDLPCRYALIGAATDLPWQGTAAESSTAMKYGYTNASTPDCNEPAGLPSGHLDGILQRDRDGLYTPAGADAVGPTDNSLYQILYSPGWYQPDQAWPMDDDLKGLQYVADHTGLCPGPGSPCYPDVRSAYPDTGIDFHTALSELQELNPKFNPCDPSVCGPDFPALYAELFDEFTWVNNVRNLISNLQKPYGLSDTVFDVQAVTGNVLDNLPEVEDKKATMQWLQIFSGVMTIAQKIAAKTGDEAAAAVFGLVGTAGTLATQLVTPEDGSLADSVKATAKALPGEMLNQQLAYINWTGHAENILVSTYQQLHAAGIKIWSWSTDTTTQAIIALRASATASAYAALLPVAYGGYNLKPGPTLAGSNDVSTYYCEETGDSNGVRPFLNALQKNQYQATTSPGVSQVWTFANVIPDTFVNNGVPTVKMPTDSTIADYLYGSKATTTQYEGPNGTYFGAFQFEPSWWRSTYNPPSHTVCNTKGAPTQPYSTAWPPPPISRP